MYSLAVLQDSDPFYTKLQGPVVMMTMPMVMNPMLTMLMMMMPMMMMMMMDSDPFYLSDDDPDDDHHVPQDCYVQWRS